MKTIKFKKENELIKLYQKSKLAWGSLAKNESIYKYKTGYYKIKKFNKKKYKIIADLSKKFDKEYKIAIFAERKFLKAINPNLHKSYLQYIHKD